MNIQLIVGLGNPGTGYKLTRHNVGFWVLDAIAREKKVSFNYYKKFLGEICKVAIDGKEFTLLKPATFMNHSGQSVYAFTHYFKLEPTTILVIHDELDLAPGRIKFKQGGSSGGHNGLKDIDVSLGSNSYYRLRVGIGHPLQDNELSHLRIADFVLAKPDPIEKAKIEKAIDNILIHLPLIVRSPLTQIQQVLHSL